MNLLCGALGVIFTFQGALHIAFYLMLAAAVCDFFDGFAARLLKAYSPMGKELDSLADLVSFGLLPSMMFHRRLVEGGMTGFVAYIPLIICVFSALRLAKFNVDDRQTENFLGLPVPANALFVSSSIALIDHYPFYANSFVSGGYLIPILSVLLGILLVSEIPMFSMKMKSLKWSANRLRYTFILIIIPVSAVIYLLNIHWTGIISFIFGFYIILNIAIALFRKFSDK